MSEQHNQNNPSKRLPLYLVFYCFLRSLDFFILVVPTVVLLIWTVIYWQSLISHLINGKYPVTFKYEAEGGEYTIRSNSVSIFPKDSRLILDNSSIMDPHGRTLASVKHVDFKLSKDVAIIYAEGVVLYVERSRKGFSIQKALPKIEGTGRATPYRAYIRGVSAYYSDASVKPVLREIGRSRYVQVEGTGVNWLAKAVVDLQNVGTIPTVVEHEPRSGLFIDLRLTQTNLGPVWAHLRRWIPHGAYERLEPIEWHTAHATGRLALHVKPHPASHRLHIDSDLFLEAKGARLASFFENANIGLRLQSHEFDIRAVGKLNEPGTEVQFDGTAHVIGHPNITGKLLVFSNSEQRWRKLLGTRVPQNISFTDGRLDSWISWNDKGFQLNGNLGLGQLSWSNYPFKDLQATIDLNNKYFVAQVHRSQFETTQASGSIEANFSNNTIKGLLDIKEADLESFSAYSKVPNIAGKAQANIVMEGTLQNPHLYGFLRGSGQYKLGPSVALDAGSFKARLSYHDSKIFIDRVAFKGGYGNLGGFGVYDVSKDALALNIGISDVDLSNLSAFKSDLNIQGIAGAQLKVFGSLSNPEARGWVEAREVKFCDRDIPIASADVFVNREKVDLENVQSPTSLGQAVGNLEYVFKDKNLKGTFNADGLLLSDWLGDNYNGIFSLNKMFLETTPKGIQVAGQLRAKDLMFFDFPLDVLDADVKADAKGVSLHSINSTLGDGSIKGSAEFLYSGLKLDAHLQTKSIPLMRLPISEKIIPLEGTIGGDVDIRALGGTLDFLKTGLGFGDVKINRRAIGEGSLSITYQNKKWEAFGVLGTLERTLQLESFLYDANARDLNLKSYSENIAIEDLFQIARPYIVHLLPDTLQQFSEKIKGNLWGYLNVNGSITHPEVQTQGLAIKNLEVNGRKAGEIQLDASRKDGMWDIRNVEWRSDNNSLKFVGSLEETGKIQLDGKLADFDLFWLHTLFPNFPHLLGTANSQFHIFGQTRNPELSGNLTLSNLGYWNQQEGVQKLPLTISSGQILMKDGDVQFNGKYAYQALTGPIKANVLIPSLAFPAQQKQSGLYSARVDLDARDLSELSKSFSWIDANRTSGAIYAWAEIKEREGRPSLRGEATLSKGQFGIEGIDTGLIDLEGKVAWTQNSLQGSIHGKGSDRGDLSLSLTGGGASWLEGNGTLSDRLASIKLNGALKIDDLDLRASNILAIKQASGQCSSEIKISGSLLEPLLMGSASMDNVDIVVRPSPELAEQPAIKYIINPVLDNIQIKTSNPARFRSTSSVAGIRTFSIDMLLGAEGTLRGSLESPF